MGSSGGFEPRSKLSRFFFYGTGEAATSLVMNGLNGFALLFYTQAMGLSPMLAGLALSLSVFWEAFTEPAMGYLSDRTRTRFGARKPWIAAGAVGMAISFVFLWLVPDAFRGGGPATFAWLVGINLVFRTALTMFVVPYLALGFEIAPDYADRPRLQGVRWVCNMAANMLGPALAWMLFFTDRHDGAGRIVSGTSIATNFEHMGIVFSIAVLVLTVILLTGTRGASRDNRTANAEAEAAQHTGFIASLRPIAADADAIRVLVLTFLMCAGMVVVSSVQAYVYVDFMIFSSAQKTLVHGSTMVAAATGAALSPALARRLDKKGAIVAGSIIGIAGQVGLAALFLTGLMPRSGVSAITGFVFFQFLYWLASGIVLPVATAMIADLAELARLRTGRTTDGTYSAIFSLAWRLGVGASLALAGVLLSAIGFDSTPGVSQSPDTAWRITAVGLAGGTVFYALAILWVRSYSLDRDRYAALTAIASPSPTV